MTILHERWDEHCPHCGKKIEDLYTTFEARDYALDFERACPHCGRLIEVRVSVAPEFALSKPEAKQSAWAAGGGDRVMG